MVPDAADPLDAVSDATLVVDGSGTVQLASGRAESVFGRRREALAGRAIDDLLVASAESKPAGDAPSVDDGAGRRDTDADGFSWTRYLDDPEPVSITDGLDVYARRGDGATSLVRLGLTPVVHEDDTSVVATAVDLSRERTRTARLHRQTETLASLHHATQELLTKTDNENAAETAVEYIDDVVGFSIAAIWLYDAEHDALEPAAWTDAAGDLFDTHPTYAADDEALSWEAFESGEPRYVPDVHDEPDRYNAETPIRSELIVPLGRYGVLNVGSTEPNALDADDRTIARLWGASVTMVFVRIERERQLREREADIARERDRLEEFAGLVSHDLRTPLNVAQGHLEAVRAETDNEKLETAAAALDRMEALIADLLPWRGTARRSTTTSPSRSRRSSRRSASPSGWTRPSSPSPTRRRSPTEADWHSCSRTCWETPADTPATTSASRSAFSMTARGSTSPTTAPESTPSAETRCSRRVTRASPTGRDSD